MQQTNSIGTAMLNELLWTITDYDCVRLTMDEFEKLEERVLDLQQMEQVEKEINLFLKDTGYTYNHDDCVWERESDALYLELEERVIAIQCNTTVKLWTGKYDYYLFKTNATNEKSRYLLEKIKGKIEDYSSSDIVPYFKSKGYEAIEIPIPKETLEYSW